MRFDKGGFYGAAAEPLECDWEVENYNFVSHETCLL